MKVPIVVLLTLLVAITLASVASMSYLYGKLSNQNAQPSASPTAQASQTPPESPPAASPVIKNEGTITGTLGYPSEFIPKGRVKAQNINTKQVVTVTVEGLINNVGSDKFAITVPPGTYYLKYEACADSNKPNDCLSGYYTTSDGTAPNQPHDLISVKVKTGETVNNIKISDFYSSPTIDPGF